MAWNKEKQQAWRKRLVEEAWNFWKVRDPIVYANLTSWEGVGPIIGRLGPSKVQTLLEQLSDKDAEVRKAAAWALGELGTAAAPKVLDMLKERLHDEPEAKVRQAINAALDRLDLDRLKYILDERSGDLEATIDKVTAAEPTISALLEQLSDKDVELCGTVTATSKVMCDLAQCLAYEKDSRVRQEVALALWSLGSAQALPKEVADILLERLEDEDEQVCRAAALALGKIDKTTALTVIPKLLAFLKDKRKKVRLAAALALGELGPVAATTEEVVHALMECLKKDKSPRVRALAIGALREMVPASDRPELVRLLLDHLVNHKKDEIRRAAVWCLWRLSSQASKKETIETLLKLLEDKDAAVRQAAALVLGKLRRTEAVGSLVERLRDAHEDVAVQRAVIDALGKLGSAAATAEILELLLECARKNEQVRLAVVRAINAFHQQKIRFFKDEQGRWLVKTVSDLTENQV